MSFEENKEAMAKDYALAVERLTKSYLHLRKLKIALEKVLPYLRTSYDLPESTNAVLISQAQALRNAADFYEKKDSDIVYAREVLKDLENDLKEL